MWPIRQKIRADQEVSLSEATNEGLERQEPEESWRWNGEFWTLSKWQPGHSRQPYAIFYTYVQLPEGSDSTRSRKSNLIYSTRKSGNLYEAISHLTFEMAPKSAKLRKACLWRRLIGHMKNAFNSEIGCRSWSPSNGTDTNFKSHSRTYCYRPWRRLEELVLWGLEDSQDCPDKKMNYWV